MVGTIDGLIGDRTDAGFARNALNSNQEQDTFYDDFLAWFRSRLDGLMA